MSRTLETPDTRSSLARNVHLYNDAGVMLGGLYQNGSFTSENLYHSCPHFLVFSPPDVEWGVFRLNEDGSTDQYISRNQMPIQPGCYAILRGDGTALSVHASDEEYHRRVITNYPSSSKLSTWTLRFRREIRHRDQGCMISGQRAASYCMLLDEWTSFDASHIFPLARETEWTQRHFQDLITDPAPSHDVGMTKIHSPQNGLLLASHIHQLFNSFHIFVNVDDNYKVVRVTEDDFDVDGKQLGFNCRNPDNPLRVRDDLLRWHYHNAILAHMRGAAEAPWEFDFADGDMMGEIMEGSDAGERMEAELFTRLAI